MNKNIYKSIFFIVFFLLINIGYFFVYFIFLTECFSWLNFLFSLIGSSSLFLLGILFKNRIWRVTSAILLFSYYIWTLLNFAYFKVFNTFLDLGTKQIGLFGSELTTMIKDFSFLVPIILYVFAFVCWLAVVVIFWQADKINENLRLTLLSEQNFNFNKLKVKRLLLLLFVFMFINFFAFTVSAYYTENPKSEWWSLEKQNTEVGLWGNLYLQIFKKVSKDEINEIVLENNDLPINKTEQKSLSLVEQIKKLWQEAGIFTDLQPLEIELPQFEEKPDILMIQLESVANWAIYNEPSPMPFLKSLIEENISVPDFHANSCETINAEFSSLCSFLPNSFEPVTYSHLENDYYCLPSILKDRYNYQNYFFHSNVSDFWRRDLLTPKWGFDNLYFTPYFRQKEADDFVFSNAVNILKKESLPWLAYIVSFTTHSPHNQELIEYNKEKNDLIIEPFSGDVNDEYLDIEISEAEVRNYFGFLTATDNALKNLFEQLDQSGLADNTVVVIYNDHRFYGFEGESLENFNDFHQQPFVLVLPQKTKGAIQPLASHIDIAPTLLNIVEQEDYEPQGNFLGQSLFAENYMPQAMNKCLGNVYFKNQNVIIQGNASNNAYQYFFEKESKYFDKSLLLDLVKNLIKISDEAIYTNSLLK